MDTQNVIVDSKGRILLPNSFRKILGVKNGENMVAQLDKENERLLLFPIEKKTKRMVIALSDQAGSLAKAAAILAKNKADLVYSESRSTKRGLQAEWVVVADFSNTSQKKLESDLKHEPAIKGFRFERLRQ